MSCHVLDICLLFNDVVTSTFAYTLMNIPAGAKRWVLSATLWPGTGQALGTERKKQLSSRLKIVLNWLKMVGNLLNLTRCTKEYHFTIHPNLFLAHFWSFFTSEHVSSKALGAERHVCMWRWLTLGAECHTLARHWPALGAQYS